MFSEGGQHRCNIRVFMVHICAVSVAVLPSRIGPWAYTASRTIGLGTLGRGWRRLYRRYDTAPVQEAANGVVLLCAR